MDNMQLSADGGAVNVDEAIELVLLAADGLLGAD